MEAELGALREERAALRLSLTDAERRARSVRSDNSVELDLRDRIDLVDDRVQKRVG